MVMDSETRQQLSQMRREIADLRGQVHRLQTALGVVLGDEDSAEEAVRRIRRILRGLVLWANAQPGPGPTFDGPIATPTSGGPPGPLPIPTGPVMVNPDGTIVPPSP